MQTQAIHFSITQSMASTYLVLANRCLFMTQLFRVRVKKYGSKSLRKDAGRHILYLVSLFFACYSCRIKDQNMNE